MNSTVFSRSRQRGITFAGFVFLIVFGLALGKAVIVLGPLYLENRLLKQVVADLQQEVNQKGLDRREVVEILGKKLLINNIRYLDPRKMPVTRRDENLVLIIQYEQRRHYFGNVDLVLSFGPHELLMPLAR